MRRSSLLRGVARVVRGRRRPACVLAWLSVLVLVGVASADLIVLRDGHEYEGTLVKATDAQVVFRHGGEEKAYARTEVVHVRLQRVRDWDGVERAADIADPILQQCLQRDVSPEQYPGAGTVTLYSATTIRLRGPQMWEREGRAVVRVLNEHGEGASIRQVQYRPDVDEVHILHGISVRTDGTVAHLRDTAVQDEAVFSDYPRYDKVRRRRFALPEGKAGIVLDAATRVVRERPLSLFHFADEFAFGGMDPVLDMRVAIFVPQGCELRWCVVNDDAAEVKHVEESADGGTWHRWRRENSPHTMPEPMMPPWGDVVPRLAVSAWPGSWEEQAKQFEQALAEADSRYPDLPEPPADSAVGLWEHVSRDVQAQGASLLATGLTPGDPSETWRLRAGAPLDRTYLLYRWLRKIGVGGARWVWIRPRGQGRLIREVPALTAFSVPAIMLPGSPPSFLVPGDDLDAPGEPAGRLGGAPCLVAGGGLELIPIPDAADDGTHRKITVVLDREGNASVREKTTYTGSAARGLREWRRLTEQEIRNGVEQRVRSVDARATSPKYRVVGDVKRNLPEMSLELTYEVPQFADSRPTLCSLRPPWLEYGARSVGRDKHQFPLFWSTPRSDSVQVEVRFPAELVVYAVPEPTTADGGPCRLQTEAHEGDGSVGYTVRYERAALEAPAADYTKLKACLETRASIGRQYWVWKKARKADRE